MTAVEWLWKALLDSGFEDIEDVEGFYYQALEMEKQQHEITWEKSGNGNYQNISFEQYYSETYKKDKI